MALDPVTGMAVGAGLNTLGALPGFVNSFQQDALRRRLMRQGPQDITPVAFRQMQAGLENQANNAQIAGYGQAMDNINEQQATTLGEAKRAGLSSSNLLNTLSRLNQQGMAAKRQLAMQGQQAKEQRMNRALQAQGQRGQYQEQGRREFNATIGALKGAAQQQRNALYQAPFTGALAGMRYGGGGESGAATPTAEDVKFTTGDISTTPDPNELGDMGGADNGLNVLERVNATGLEKPSIGYMKRGLSFDPYKTPPIMQTPYLNSTYQNMFNPSAARSRMINSPVRTSPYYNFE